MPAINGLVLGILLLVLEGHQINTIPTYSIYVLSLSLPVELHGFCLFPFVNGEVHPHHKRLLDPLLAKWNHLVGKDGSLLLLGLDVGVQLQEYICFQDQLRAFLESLDYHPVVHSVHGVVEQLSEARLDESVVPQDLGGLSQDSLSLESIQDGFPVLKDAFKENLFHILLPHSIDVVLVHVLKQDRESSPLRIECPESVLSFLQT